MHRSKTVRLFAATVVMLLTIASGVAAAAPGIDVSRFQDEIDWSGVAADGYSFAFIRATGGTLTIDERYDENRLGAGQFGIRMGAYHFANPNGDTLRKIKKDALAEADLFLSIAQPAPGDLFPVLDVEGHLNDVKTRWLKIWLRIWLERVEAAVDEKPIIYTNPSTWKNRLNNTTEFAEAGHPLWIAHYTTAPSPEVPAANWAGNGWAFWQFTDRGTVTGIEGDVDLDNFSGTTLDRYTIPVLPTNTALPSVSGTPETGSTLTATTGTWKGTKPLFYTYRWMRCDAAGDGCVPIAGARLRSYSVQGEDFGNTLRIRIKARNAAGEAYAFSDATGTILDGAPPVAGMSSPARPFDGPEIPVGWAASDDASGVAWYDVRYRRSFEDGTLGAWVPWQNDTTETSASFTGEQGVTYCFAVQAMDNSGNVSDWSPAACTAVRIDDTALAGSGFGRKDSPAAYLGTYSQTKKKGSRLRLPGVEARSLDLVVGTCKSCGSVDVFLDGKRLARVDLRSRRTRWQRVARLADFSRVRSGTLKIVVISSGKVVRIDGVGASLR